MRGLNKCVWLGFIFFALSLNSARAESCMDIPKLKVGKYDTLSSNKVTVRRSPRIKLSVNYLDVYEPGSPHVKVISTDFGPISVTRGDGRDISHVSMEIESILAVRLRFYKGNSLVHSDTIPASTSGKPLWTTYDKPADGPFDRLSLDSTVFRIRKICANR